jgi:maltooligosyltrehalose trehalohydrolase
LLRKFYRELLRIRKQTPALLHLAMDQCRATPLGENTLLVERWCEGSEILMLLHFSDQIADLTLSHPTGRWVKLIYSADLCWNGTSEMPSTLRASDEKVIITMGPRSIALYERS